MRAAIAAVLTAALMTAPATALAQEQADRPYEVTVSEESAEIQIAEKGEDASGETRVLVDTHEGVLASEYSLEDREDAKARLEVALHQLVEYEDENDDDRFDGEDEVVSAWRLSNESRNVTEPSNGTVEWRALEMHNVTSDDGVEGTRVSGVAEFPSQDPLAGVVSQLGQTENRTVHLNLTVFGQPAVLDGTQIDATQVAVDWTVDNYPYTQEDTQLALVAGANGTSPLTLDARDNHTVVALSTTVADQPVGLAAGLADQATVDGNQTAVESGEIDGPEEDAAADRYLAVSYERGETIRQDAHVGSNVTEPTGIIGSAEDEVSTVPGFAMGAAATVLAGVAALTRRG